MGSPEHSPHGAMGHETSPQLHENGEVKEAVLTMGVGGQRVDRDGRMVMDNGGGCWSSMLGNLDHGGVK
jgi:hypothetical protein